MALNVPSSSDAALLVVLMRNRSAEDCSEGQTPATDQANSGGNYASEITSLSCHEGADQML